MTTLKILELFYELFVYQGLETLVEIKFQTVYSSVTLALSPSFRISSFFKLKETHRLRVSHKSSWDYDYV